MPSRAARSLIDKGDTMNRQARRVQRAIDELIKIQDDGKGTGELQHIIDALNSLEQYYYGSE